jgi:universal stress protein E
VLPDVIKDEKARKLLRNAADKQLLELSERVKIAGIKTGDPILAFGVHFEKIVEAAERIDANLILIGAGEEKRQGKFPLGTTAEKIIRKSGKPVWVVKPGQAFDIKTILCPVDFSGESALALRNALVMTRRFEARLIVLSVFEKSYGAPKPPSQDWDAFEDYWEKQEDKERKAYLDQFNDFLEGFSLQGVNLEKKILDGNAAEEILAAIDKYEVDLLVMGTTGRTGLSRWMMGSVTEKVIREVPCTFLTTKSEDVIKLQLEARISDIEKHYPNGLQLMEDGFFREAIQEFKTCLDINDMHVPSLFGIAKVYDRLGDEEMAAQYRKMAREVLVRIYDSKIEEEIRKHYRY